MKTLVSSTNQVIKDLEFYDLTDEQVEYIYDELKQMDCIWADEHLQVNFAYHVAETDEMMYEVVLVSDNCTREVCFIAR